MPSPRRRAVARVAVLDHEAINRMPTWTRDEWLVHRDEVIARWHAQLWTIEPFWAYEPGIPDHLRTLPELPELRLLDVRAPVPAETQARIDAESLAYQSIVVSRDRWLADHPEVTGV